jgi:hypothetical protein
MRRELAATQIIAAECGTGESRIEHGSKCRLVAE